MAKLKDIKGSAIQYLAEDPVEYVGTWSSASSVNQARSGVGSAGTRSANLMFGGPAPGGHGAKTELYDGSTWTEVNDLNTPRHSAGSMGTSTAAVYCGGRATPSASTTASENWNGTSWTEGNDINRSRYGVGNKGSGTQTAGLIAGGNQRFSPVTTPNYFAGTEEYDGTSWTEVNDLPSGLESGGGIGTQTAAGLWGGYSGSYTTAGQLYDGTNWTSTTAMPITGGAYGSSGTTTDGILFGFFIGPSSTSTGNTVSWDGTAFTEQNDLSTARYNGAFPKGSGDPSQVAIMAAGYSGTADVANTEEWSFPPSTATTLNEGDMWFNYTSSALKGFGTAAGLPAATWSSGGSINSARRGLGGAGSTNTAVLAFGGTDGTNRAYTESYNGSSWTELTDLNTARSFTGGAGVQTAALAFSGATANTETWNGSSWTEVNNMNTSRNTIGAAGLSNTAALGFGGDVPPLTTKTESWDGSSWTEVNDLNTARNNGAGLGTSTAAIYASGSAPGNSTAVENWDGSSWTEIAELNTARYGARASGVTTSGLVFGGNPTSTKTESWNGTAWTELNDLATGREAGGYGRQAGNTEAIFAGGYLPSPGGYSAVTEEWTASSAVATVTTS